MVRRQRPVVAVRPVAREIPGRRGGAPVLLLRPRDLPAHRQHETACDRQSRAAREHLGPQQPDDRVQALEPVPHREPDATGVLGDLPGQPRVPGHRHMAQGVHHLSPVRQRPGDSGVDPPRTLRVLPRPPRRAVVPDQRVAVAGGKSAHRFDTDTAGSTGRIDAAFSPEGWAIHSGRAVVLRTESRPRRASIPIAGATGFVSGATVSARSGVDDAYGPRRRHHTAPPVDQDALHGGTPCNCTAS